MNNPADVTDEALKAHVDVAAQNGALMMWDKREAFINAAQGSLTPSPESPSSAPDEMDYLESHISQIYFDDYNGPIPEENEDSQMSHAEVIAFAAAIADGFRCSISVNRDAFNRAFAKANCNGLSAPLQELEQENTDMKVAIDLARNLNEQYCQLNDRLVRESLNRETQFEALKKGGN